MIFNPDKTCPVENICEIPIGDVYEISDITVNYREMIKALKKTAGWNQPYESTFEN